jgi:adenosylmethionine---8-amino-7-oxononanoate aminotransferase
MNLSEKDARLVWHPFTQQKTALPPIPVVKAEGCWLISETGKKYLDANSSWWTCLHGHSHLYIAQKVYEQFLQLEHVIFAGITHPKAVEIADRILNVLPGFDKVFFSDNGSTSVEVALKMVYQFWSNSGRQKKRFLALEGAYHGDTFGAMSVGQRGHFNKPFEHLFFDVDFLPFPTAEHANEVVKKAEELFSTGEFAGFIFEPLVQGAAGMRMYSPAVLDELLLLAKKYNVLCVADEVMTGFYRTGTFFAIDQLRYKPDIVCLSKGLTGGVLPMGLTIATREIFNAFWSDDKAKALLHGHSFTANPLACAAACASFDLLTKKETQDAIEMITSNHGAFVEQQKSNAGFRSVESAGTILAIELAIGEESSYFHSIRDEAYAFFLERGFLIRPIGSRVFVNPPYCITSEELKSVYNVILDFSINSL